MSKESRLEMIERHVRQGQRHLDRQAEIIEQNRRLGLSTVASEQLLKTFEATQALHLEHLARIQVEQS